jgi:hypothetical protein
VNEPEKAEGKERRAERGSNRVAGDKAAEQDEQFAEEEWRRGEAAQ